ncbi:MAG: hypothetical protein GY757_51165, partial [bacterium]|nr:hypothetical protein [bacterium]
NEFERRLEHASIFRKIRLAYALKHRIHPKGSIVYRVRNGRGWATELFYLKKGTQEPRILTVNYYNFNAKDAVDCKILAAHESTKKFGSNYMVDVNNVIAGANIKIVQKQTILGLITNVNGENRVYFANVSMGTSITSSGNIHTTHTRKYLIGSTINSVGLREILRMAGATVVDEIPEGEYRDLSPAALNKETLIDLINPQNL